MSIAEITLYDFDSYEEDETENTEEKENENE